MTKRELEAAYADACKLQTPAQAKMAMTGIITRPPSREPPASWRG